ncbi:MAG TPA: response regulator transcription factor [Prolixibacteraceae bacterium]|jgi:DNA-binding response OmpR family regulator|nr:response regulator transcription factor [Prolixibacteraceae bacterium]
MEGKLRILIAEDEEDLCEIVQFNLESEGYIVEAVHSAEEALKRDLASYDLLLLDVMMGKMSGFGLAQRVRKEMGLEMPVIFLTARNSENDLLTGFNIGADDYITKPFSVRELQARVRTVLKRSGRKAAAEVGPTQLLGEIVIDHEAKRVIIGAEKVDLTRKEYEIFALLVRHPGRIFSREEILGRIWEDDVIVTDRTVDVNIARLRKKLGDYSRYLRNKAGYGYYIEV